MRLLMAVRSVEWLGSVRRCRIMSVRNCRWLMVVDGVLRVVVELALTAFMIALVICCWFCVLLVAVVVVK